MTRTHLLPAHLMHSLGHHPYEDRSTAEAATAEAAALTLAAEAELEAEAAD